MAYTFCGNQHCLSHATICFPRSCQERLVLIVLSSTGNGLVDTVSRLRVGRPRNHGLIPCKSNKLFLSPQRGLTCVLLIWHRRLFQGVKGPRHEADYHIIHLVPRFRMSGDIPTLRHANLNGVYKETFNCIVFMNV